VVGVGAGLGEADDLAEVVDSGFAARVTIGHLQGCLAVRRTANGPPVAMRIEQQNDSPP
jgi:hypothetical protein